MKTEHFIRSKMVWVDIETTGLWQLDHNLPQREMLEIALTITDYNLNKLDGYVSLVLPSEKALETMDSYVKDMHTRNGLLADIEAAGNTVPTVEQVEKEILEILKQHKTYDNYLYWTGNSIAALDLKFLGHYMPNLSMDRNGPMHYHSIDVTSLRLALGFYTGINYFYKKAEAHRALDDVNSSIKEYEFILDQAFNDARS
jgi:oligoribonuclease